MEIVAEPTSGETRPSQWWLSPAAAPAEWAPTSRCCELRAARSRGVQRHSPRAPGRLWCARRRCRRSPISTIAASRSWATNRRTAVRRLRPRTAWPGLSLHRRGRRRARSSPCWPVTWRCSAARRSLRCERICRPAPVSRGWSPPRGPVRTGSARCGGSIRSCRNLRRVPEHRCDRRFEVLAWDAVAALVGDVDTPDDAHRLGVRSGEPIRLLCLNVRSSFARDGDDRWSLRGAALARFVVGCEPEIVALQEATGEAAATSVLRSLRAVGGLLCSGSRGAGSPVRRCPWWRTASAGL